MSDTAAKLDDHITILPKHVDFIVLDYIHANVRQKVSEKTSILLWTATDEFLIEIIYKGL